MTAGLVTLRRLRDKSVYERLEASSNKLCAGLAKAAQEAGIKTITNRVGSMWTSFFTDEPVIDWQTANRSNRERFARLREAVQLIRRLWSEDVVTFDGDYYHTRNAKIFDRPEEPVPIYVGAGGPQLGCAPGRPGADAGPCRKVCPWSRRGLG